MTAALEHLRELPGVDGVGAVAATPYDEDAQVQPVNREDDPVDVAEAMRAEERVLDVAGAAGLVGAVRNAAPQVTVAWVRPLSDLLGRDWAAAESAARLFAALALTALGVCMLGVYGAATVAQRPASRRASHAGSPLTVSSCQSE